MFECHYLLIVYQHHEIHLLIELDSIAGIDLSVGSIAEVDGNVKAFI